MRALRGLVLRVADGLALLGGAVVLCFAAYTIADVTLRAALNAPLPGGVDVVSYGLGLAVALMLPLGFAREHHVAVTLVPDNLPPRGRSLMLALTSAVSGAVIALVGYRAILYAVERANVGDTMWILQYPVWPIWAVIAAMFCVTALVLVAVVVLHLADAARPDTARERAQEPSHGGTGEGMS